MSRKTAQSLGVDLEAAGFSKTNILTGESELDLDSLNFESLTAIADELQKEPLQVKILQGIEKKIGDLIVIEKQKSGEGGKFDIQELIDKLKGKDLVNQERKKEGEAKKEKTEKDLREITVGDLGPSGTAGAPGAAGAPGEAGRPIAIDTSGGAIPVEVTNRVANQADDIGEIRVASAAVSTPSIGIKASSVSVDGGGSITPNFAPSPLQRAMETERKMGGTPIVAHHPSLKALNQTGAYVRDSSIQKNFSDVKRTHPEGISKAVQRSATMQSAKTSSVVPNFAINPKTKADLEAVENLGVGGEGTPPTVDIEGPSSAQKSRHAGEIKSPASAPSEARVSAFDALNMGEKNLDLRMVDAPVYGADPNLVKGRRFGSFAEDIATQGAGYGEVATVPMSRFAQTEGMSKVKSAAQVGESVQGKSAAAMYKTRQQMMHEIMAASGVEPVEVSGVVKDTEVGPRMEEGKRLLKFSDEQLKSFEFTPAQIDQIDKANVSYDVIDYQSTAKNLVSGEKAPIVSDAKRVMPMDFGEVLPQRPIESKGTGMSELDRLTALRKDLRKKLNSPTLAENKFSGLEEQILATENLIRAEEARLKTPSGEVVIEGKEIDKMQVTDSPAKPVPVDTERPKPQEVSSKAQRLEELSLERNDLASRLTAASDEASINEIGEKIQKNEAARQLLETLETPAEKSSPVKTTADKVAAGLSVREGEKVVVKDVDAPKAPKHKWTKTEDLHAGKLDRSLSTKEAKAKSAKEISNPRIEKLTRLGQSLDASIDANEFGSVPGSAGPKSSMTWRPDQLGTEDIKFHGFSGGRAVVEVGLPGGQTQLFYKSSGTGGKTVAGADGGRVSTENLWQPFGGFKENEIKGPVANWFIKGDGSEAGTGHYGSKTFGAIGERLGQMEGDWDMSLQIGKSKVDEAGKRVKADRSTTMELFDESKSPGTLSSIYKDPEEGFGGRKEVDNIKITETSAPKKPAVDTTASGVKDAPKVAPTVRTPEKLKPADLFGRVDEVSAFDALNMGEADPKLRMEGMPLYGTEHIQGKTGIYQIGGGDVALKEQTEKALMYDKSLRKQVESGKITHAERRRILDDIFDREQIKLGDDGGRRFREVGTEALKGRAGYSGSSHGIEGVYGARKLFMEKIMEASGVDPTPENMKNFKFTRESAK